MAAGMHWEWRGFGEESAVFNDRFGRLNSQFGPQQVQDRYIWAPDLQVNLKIREGVEGGLKLKRLLGKDGRLERWLEDPDELFDFPLQQAAWHTLADELARAGLSLDGYPDEPPGSDQLLDLLGIAGCKTVLVRKERESRWWPGPHGRVQVERAVISLPQQILSISLESEEVDVGEDGLTSEQAKAAILAAGAALDMDQEPLTVMNYMDAVTVWAEGSIINC